MSGLSDQADRFIRQANRLRNCCRRVEKQFGRGGLKITDVELVYASSFLSACSLWESLLEVTLFEAVCGEESRYSGNTRLATFKKRRHLERLLLYPKKDYVSIPSLSKAEEMASLFISSGGPFSAVTETNRTHIQQATWIRNAIAHQHQGAFAMNSFKKKVPGVLSLPSAKRTPGAFLRHEFRVSPSQRRYELYLAAFQSAAKEIGNAW